MSGWYITKTVAAPGTVDAGQPCYAVMLDGVFQQGFPGTLGGRIQAQLWGLSNGKGWLPCR